MADMANEYKVWCMIFGIGGKVSFEGFHTFMGNGTNSTVRSVHGNDL